MKLVKSRMTQTHAKIHFNDKGTPISEQFDDVYFSDAQGLAETQYVFLQHNLLPQRLSEFDNKTFHIAETGFGTGLNFLTTWQALNKFNLENNTKAALSFLTFEKYPIAKADLQQAYVAFPELSDLCEQILAQYPAQINSDFTIKFADNVTLTVVFGDVNTRIPELTLPENSKINAWYLDGFAPNKNPDMWTQNLFENMARLANTDCTLATFTAAGFVRRGLIEAGFAMKKFPGFGHKREMIAGQLKTND